MKRSFFSRLVILFLFSVFFASAEISYVSGKVPNSRPGKAPKITKSNVLAPQIALHGIQGEIPISLSKIIGSQGGWYTPLVNAGMTGPYDIREFHKAEDVNKSEIYFSKQWDPIHFKPQIDKATDAQCLSCHQNIINHKVLEKSQAGVKSSDVLAWYQTLDTYSGSQENFHWRHLESPLSKKITQFRCTTCHQGNDPREEAWVPKTNENVSPFTLRKGVNPQVCLMCHGQFPDYKIMNLPGDWKSVGNSFQNNCLSCHVAFRTNRHQVNFLKPEAIEDAGRESGDSCYGCHGGRAWYRISYPYPRHSWPGMSEEIPAWAKDRPTESVKRFIENNSKEVGK